MTWDDMYESEYGVWGALDVAPVRRLHADVTMRRCVAPTQMLPQSVLCVYCICTHVSATFYPGFPKQNIRMHMMNLYVPT